MTHGGSLLPSRPAGATWVVTGTLALAACSQGGGERVVPVWPPQGVRVLIRGPSGLRARLLREPTVPEVLVGADSRKYTIRPPFEW